MSQLTLISSAELEALRSRPDGRDSERSDSQRLTPTLPPSCESTGPTCRTSETSPNGEIGQTLEMFSSLPEGSRVSRFPAPGSAEARQMTVSSGRQCSQLLDDTSPLGCLVKMCLESSEWNSTVCLLTWRALVTPQGRLGFQLVHWEPTTPERGFGLLPTPRAQMKSLKWRKHGRFSNLESLPEHNPQFFAELSGRNVSLRWLETYMGYPDGHTELEPLATPSSRKSHK